MPGFDLGLATDKPPGDFCPGAFGQLSEFIERVLNLPLFFIAEHDSDQQDGFSIVILCFQ